MQYRLLGQTGLSISRLAFGAGPVSGLLTGETNERQIATVKAALQSGINWFDTAATYGQGRSESSLGHALAQLRPEQPLHIATKVRVNLTAETDLRPLVIDSVRESLQRLQLPRVTLLQIHNSITRNRDDQPTSLTPDDVLGPRGVLAGMEEARAAGWVSHFGITGIGDAESLCTVIRSGHFSTIQAPLHFLNPSALRPVPPVLGDPDYGGFLIAAHEQGMGIFAIRVFAAGALLGAEPSAHTLKTPFFPLALYQRDLERVRRLLSSFGSFESMDALRQTALQYILSLPEVSAAIIGFGDPAHVDQGVIDSFARQFSASEIASLEERRNRILCD